MGAGEVRFTKSHEWVSLEGNTATIGITDYAQHELGDIVFVELPPVGKTVKAGDVLTTVESVKSVSEVYAPVPGTVAEVNGALDGTPGLVNSAPEGAGWIVKLTLAGREEFAKLLDRAAYDRETAT